jgi:lipopolysaccharide export system protein LptA
VGIVGLLAVTYTQARMPHNISPIDVHAEGALELCLNKRQLTARKNVRMVQEDTTIWCQTMEVYFADPAGSSKQPKLSVIEAMGNVVVQKKEDILQAEKLKFNVKTGLLTAYAIPGERVTLRQKNKGCVSAHRMCYNIHDAKGIASGGAQLTHQQGSVRSKRIEFYFSEAPRDPLGGATRSIISPKGRALERTVCATAIGNVRIHSKAWNGTAHSAQYDQRSEKIILRGSVRIANRHKHFGMTEYAVIDLKHNTYHVAPGCSGKPTVLFIPNRTFKSAGRK